MRKIRVPKFRAPKDPGRHASSERAKRTREERYRGTHRGTPSAPAVAVAEPRKPAPPTVRQRPQGKRLTPLSDRPNEMRASPRDRFRGADTVPARVDYERRQRDELRAQRAAGGGKLDARTHEATTKKMGQRVPARARFTGETSSAEKNRVAKQLHPQTTTARGRATRPNSALPGYGKARHGDPIPELSGRGFAGGFFGPLPTKTHR